MDSFSEVDYTIVSQFPNLGNPYFFRTHYLVESLNQLILSLTKQGPRLGARSNLVA